MSSTSHQIYPGIRRLHSGDQAALVDFFLNLDQPTRRLRFGGAVGDRFVRNYAEKILSADIVTFGAFPDDTLRGVAELMGHHDSWPRSAEVALLVEPGWQECGIGEALFNRLIAAAQNRRIKTLHMLCLRENRRMRHLAQKHHARMEIESDTVEATLAPHWPTPISIFEEIFGDTRGYFRETLYLQR